MQPALMARRLKKARWHYATAFNCYTRYAWRPATPTGHKDVARYEHHRAEADRLLGEVLAGLEDTAR